MASSPYDNGRSPVSWGDDRECGGRLVQSHMASIRVSTDDILWSGRDGFHAIHVGAIK